MTQTMTKEQTAVEWITDRFRQYQKEGYKSNWDEVIQTVLLAKEIEDKQLSAERELKAKYDSLVMDNMTHEYNAAEAERHLPDLIKQYVDRELERAGKLIGELNKLKEDMELDGYVNYSNEIDILITNYEQTLNEYDTATKES